MPEESQLNKKNDDYWRKTRTPVSAYFELTPRCTFDCRMCYVHLTPEQMGDRRELSTEEWLRVTDEALEAGLLYAVLTGGECMLHPGFWQIYERLKANGVVLTVNTNAYALTQADIDRFIKNPPTDIRVTLYGASEEGYERCTGRRAYARVVDNIKRLQQAGITLKLAVTFTRYNAEEYAGICRLSRELGLLLKYAIDLNETDPDTGRSVEDSQLTPAQMLETEIGFYKSFGYSFARNKPRFEIPPRMEGSESRGMVCAAGRSSYCVNWDGTMSLCVGFPGVVSLRENSLVEAWKRVVEASDAFETPVECNTCELRPICEPCPLARRDPKDPGHRDPQRCKTTLMRYNAGLRTLDKEAPRGADSPVVEDGFC